MVSDLHKWSLKRRSRALFFLWCIQRLDPFVLRKNRQWPFTWFFLRECIFPFITFNKLLLPPQTDSPGWISHNKIPLLFPLWLMIIIDEWVKLEAQVEKTLVWWIILCMVHTLVPKCNESSLSGIHQSHGY